MSADRPGPGPIAQPRTDVVIERVAIAQPLTQPQLADELVKRLTFLRIVTDEKTLKQIRVLAAGIGAPQAATSGDYRFDALVDDDQTDHFVNV